ncbi:MAG: glycoside hydrolase family 57 protein [Paludibacteraceae bacterium]|nr:glycoside hydrolase family 57 protein [Paludibacteraceae bacterium]
MKNIVFCFQMHAPYRLKRYRFFDIGQDHYYYDDMLTEEKVNHLVEQSYMPLCQTIKEMVQISNGKFRCALSINGMTLEMFQQFAPEMIDILRELAQTKSVEFVSTPYAYSFAAIRNENEFEDQLKMENQILQDLLGVKATTVWNTELLYSDDIAAHIYKLGYKAVMTEGAKHILSWKSPNYVYNAPTAPKLKVLLRNGNLSDELAFHFSDYKWYNYPIDAPKFADEILSLPEEEQVINIWLGAETFGLRQPANTGIFEFLKALPYFVFERNMLFATPQDVAKMPASAEVLVPDAITWAGESKGLSVYEGNDLQHEAIEKLYQVAERVRMCQDKRLRRDGLQLQDISHFHFMNHIDQADTNYESAYDAFINYMNVLSDFLLLVDEQYPTTIENEELNELLKTINNQEKEIAQLENELKKARSKKKKEE